MADAARRRATYQDVLDAPPNVLWLPGDP